MIAFASWQQVANSHNRESAARQGKPLLTCRLLPKCFREKRERAHICIATKYIHAGGDSCGLCCACAILKPGVSMKCSAKDQDTWMQKPESEPTGAPARHMGRPPSPHNATVPSSSQRYSPCSCTQQKAHSACHTKTTSHTDSCATTSTVPPTPKHIHALLLKPYAHANCRDLRLSTNTPPPPAKQASNRCSTR